MSETRSHQIASRRVLTERRAKWLVASLVATGTTERITARYDRCWPFWVVSIHAWGDLPLAQVEGRP